MQKWALPCTLGKAKQDPGSAGRWPASYSSILSPLLRLRYSPQAKESGE